MPSYKIGDDDEQIVQAVASRYGMSAFSALRLLLRYGADCMMASMQPPQSRNGEMPMPSQALLTPETEQEQQLTLESGDPKKAEIEWRVMQCWNQHLQQRRAYFLRKNGVAPTKEPKLDRDTAKWIRKAVLEYDAGLLEGQLRNQWLRESVALAAGKGIFFDSFLTGSDGGREYLEHWRPWRKQTGKAWRVQDFADLFFEQADLQGVTS